MVITPLLAHVAAEPGQRVVCPVRVVNHGPGPVSSRGSYPVRLTTRWFGTRRQPVGPPDSVPLPDLYPGETATLDVAVAAPPAVGRYALDLRLEQAGGPAVSPSVTLAVEVNASPAEDIDYFKTYAHAELARDHWTVVGPSSRAEFDELAGHKLALLRAYGLNSESRVLDVGCGTGQLAGPLAGVLSDRGAYVGTDIGPEAVAFCRGRFPQPNFRFLVSEPTRLPLSGEWFDLVTFFSVFTHTFPDETVLLLHEAARLLSPGGVVLADVFVNPFVERYGGHRGRIELEGDHFLRLAATTGLTPTVRSDVVWQGPTRRVMYAFTRDASCSPA